MDPLTLQSTLLDCFNRVRTEKGLEEIFDADDLAADVSQIFQDSGVLLLTVPEEAPEDVAKWVESEIVSNLQGDELASDYAAIASQVFAKNATHFSVIVTSDETEVQILVQTYFFYLRMEPLGPMIDGDFVLQGSIVASNRTKMSPALCVTEKQEGNDWAELLTISPDKMIISPPDDENSEEETRFMIPVSIPVEERGSTLRMKVYVKDIATIAYEGESEALDRGEMVLASLCSPAGPVEWSADMDKSGEGMEEIDEKTPRQVEQEEHKREEVAAENREGESSPLPHFPEAPLEKAQSNSRFASLNSDELENMVVQDIHIAMDYDDVVALQSEGYQLQCLQITPDGAVQDQDFLWKFHVMYRYGSKADPGIEDIQFVKCLKSLGTLPTLPFFKIMHDYDLSNPEDSYSVYLALRVGPNPRFKQIAMLCSTPEDEHHLKAYVAHQNSTYVEAPDEVDRAFPGSCGLLLLSLNADISSTARSAASSIERSVREGREKREAGLENDDETEGGSSDEDYNDEEDIVAALQQQIGELESEKHSLSSLNSELQKKVVVLMAREKALQGQAVGPGTRTGSADVTAAAGDGADAGAEQSLEKEKQYQDVLQLIVLERGKLNKQLREFDQLALDLQTRLDDKEFKAKGIAASFKQFKKEILEKATNSRTGHHIPEIQIQQIEMTELKYEEDLEKVRLRNISLRTTQKKLERTLRAREQLAEGLHMIDFEQLKIENQTLNEKIEERNEDLAKLKRKKTTTVQVLTHTREKLRFVEQANRVQQEKLSSLEQVISAVRNRTTNLKLERDDFRTENNEMKTKQSFATSDLLLSDYEQRKNKVEQLGATVQELKQRYELLNRQVQKTQQLTSTKGLSASAPWLLEKTK